MVGKINLTEEEEDAALNEYLAKNIDLRAQEIPGEAALTLRIAKLMRDAYWLGHCDGRHYDPDSPYGW